MSRPVVPLVVAMALVLAACAGTPGLDPIGPGEDGPVSDAASTSEDATAAGGDRDVLSPCAPAGDAVTAVMVEPAGERPPLDVMEEALADNPDAQFVIVEFEADGMSREDAVHAMYGQVVGDRLLEAARSLPGFVSGAYARPEQGEPFELAFSGDVPDGFDPDDFDLGSYGLEVTTGATGFDHDAFSAVYEGAIDVGIRVVSGYGDEVAGTATIEVIDATPEQVAEWEQAVGGAAATTCIVRVDRTSSCGPPVVDADRQGQVIPHGGEDTSPTAEEVAAIRASYLGLTLEEAEAKAAEEGREVRVVTEDGVELGRNDDLVPGRIDLSVCDRVVVDLTVEPTSASR